MTISKKPHPCDRYLDILFTAIDKGIASVKCHNLAEFEIIRSDIAKCAKRAELERFSCEYHQSQNSLVVLHIDKPRKPRGSNLYRGKPYTGRKS